MARTVATKQSQGKEREQNSKERSPQQQQQTNPYSNILSLQRMAGNRAVEQIVGKSAILQRKCACGNSATINGKCSKCSEQELLLQRRAAGESKFADIPPIVHEVLNSPGQSLDPGTRTFMESRFGRDFSQVRVHTDSKSAASAEAVAALAYTVGQDIVFGSGQYAPNTTQGQYMLAHELTHFIQQAEQATSSHTHLLVGNIGDVYEHEAEATANRIVNASVSNHGTIPILQKSFKPIIMRTPIFTSTMEICRRVLKSRRVFHVSEGGLVVTANATWEPSSEWEGTEPPRCGEDVYNITLSDKGWLYDSEYGSCEFAQGMPFSRTWANIPEGDYYLTIWTNNTNPNCCLRGDIMVSQQQGLSGNTCTKPPPGPLEILHDALALAGLVPALGAIPDAIDASIYVIQGDWTNAGLSAAAMIPIFGDAASVGRIGARTVVRVEANAVKKIGKDGIVSGLKAAKVAGSVLKRPTFKVLRATTSIDEKLLEMALQHRTQLWKAGENFGSHNIAVVKLVVDGVPTILSARSTVKELHSEARLIQQIDGMIANKKTVEVLQIYSERIPCTRAGCLQAINAKYPKADVFYSVSEELAESAGSKAEALKVVYGLKP